ncbi:MAG: TRAP transporter small permease subunit [Gammaproteobacteria bacterium]|nr:TRAP transporter small permease subunit [Gammaproteobacteria bacterium]
MLNTLEIFTSVFDRLNEWIGRIVAWLTLLMVLLTFAIVVARYGFNSGWIAVQESVIYMHSLVFLLGAAYTMRHQGHVRVDIFYREISPIRRAWVDLLGTIFLLLPMFVFIFWSSWEYVGAAWELKESSREAGGLPWVYLLKSSLLVMGALVVLQGLYDIVRALLIISGRRDYASLHQNEEGPMA